MDRREFVAKSITALVLGSQTAPCQSLPSASSGETDWLVSSDTLRVAVSSSGSITAMEIKTSGDWERVEFRQGAFAGPTWAGVTLQRIADTKASFAANSGGVRHSLRYEVDGDRLAVVATLKNESTTVYAPKAASLTLGINCEMLAYPAWNNRYFPTLLRCEKTHLWGYFMTPRGRILCIGSSDPIASYTLNYQGTPWGDGGHLISTCSLDLLHSPPLPPRHPQNLHLLQPGEERSWRIFLQPVARLNDVKPTLAKSLGAPMVEADRYTLAPGEISHLSIWAENTVTVTVTTENGANQSLAPGMVAEGKYATDFSPDAGPGLYRLTFTQSDGNSCEACISVRQPWSWYLRRAREASLVQKQYASSHLEQWLGLQTGVLAHRFLPEPALDAQVDTRLKEILALQWNLATKRSTRMPGLRFLVNTAQMANIVSYRYQVDRNPYWLELASGFADYVISRQHADGNYNNYTTVAYPVKCVMAVMMIEEAAAQKHPRFAAAHHRHYESARRAMDFLVRVKDDLTTEGQNTFEDGMISCGGMQLGLFALLQPDPAQRRVYADAARAMMESHRCLEQLLIPDSRMNGATLRFWEAQYDVLMGGERNMMNSPHGWSAWLIPGLWYQYLLTGEEEWLQKAMNALGSCVQVIDPHSGELRWGFVPDPYREVTMLVPDPAFPGQGRRVDAIIGEQYVPMIASFHYPSREPVYGNGWENGWTCCNDVHEIFTSLTEVALTAAYVIERAGGELITWNCTAKRDESGTLYIQPSEEIVTRVHLNLRHSTGLQVGFASGVVSTRASGMQWVGPGGMPELFSNTA